MRKTLFTFSVGLAALLAGFGCGDDDPEARILVTQHVKDFMTDEPLEGVEVCVYGRDDLDCATTDAAGNYTLEVPADADVSFHYTLTDYWPMIVEAQTPDTDWTTVDSMNMNTVFEAELLMSSSGVVLDETKGHVLVTIFDAPTVSDASLVEGVSIELSGGDGTTGYLGTNNLVDTGLTATTTAGNGIVVNVEPGQYTLTVSHPTLTCYPLYAVAGASANTFQVHVIPVATTWTNVYCE